MKGIGCIVKGKKREPAPAAQDATRVIKTRTEPKGTFKMERGHTPRNADLFSADDGGVDGPDRDSRTVAYGKKKVPGYDTGTGNVGRTDRRRFDIRKMK